MNLVIYNRIIDEPIENIIQQIKLETNYGWFSNIQDKGDYLRVTCPFHKEGRETHPSCSIYKRNDNDEIPYGTTHCFTCGKSSSLPNLVNHCFNEYGDFGKEWLYNKYGNTFIKEDKLLPKIEINSTLGNNKVDDSILTNYRFYHPYMFDRKLTEDIINKFDIGYDKELNAITFPVYDDRNNFIGVTKRLIDRKQYIIPTNIDKPIYLLNYIKKENITNVIVCESQINALTCWSWGYPAIALFGTGSKTQYDILKKSGIRTYYLGFDGDNAGKKGIDRFIENMTKDIIINVLKIPNGKDINDLSKEEFDEIKMSIDKSINI